VLRSQRRIPNKFGIGANVLSNVFGIGCGKKRKNRTIGLFYQRTGRQDVSNLAPLIYCQTANPGLGV
jgi:hypothetical protein